MNLNLALDDIFAGPSNVRVLRALFGLPDGFAASTREIARRSGLTHPTASRVLASLVEQGIVDVKRSPHADQFELNRDHIAIKPIESILRWENGIQDELITLVRTQIRRRAPFARAAFLFGSAARGDAEPGSDVDLAIVCAEKDVERMQDGLDEMAEVVQRRFGNRLSGFVGVGPLKSLTRSGRPGYRLWRKIEEEGMPILERSA